MSRHDYLETQPETAKTVPLADCVNAACASACLIRRMEVDLTLIPGYSLVSTTFAALKRSDAHVAALVNGARQPQMPQSSPGAAFGVGNVVCQIQATVRAAATSDYTRSGTESFRKLC